MDSAQNRVCLILTALGGAEVDEIVFLSARAEQPEFQSGSTNHDR